MAQRRLYENKLPENKLKIKSNKIIDHYFFKITINPLPNDNILDWSKLKAFADDKIKVTESMKFVF